MSDFFEETKYDGVDDNIEILLEGAQQDSQQAYIYIRIKANPDEERLLIERTPAEDGKEGWSTVHTPNTDMVTVLSNGTEAQIAIMFLELFEMDPLFMEGVITAIEAMKDFNKNR